MLRHLTILSALAACTLLPTALEAQEPPTPTHVVLRYFHCPNQGMAVRMFQAGEPAVQQMVEEGTFIGYGLMTHNWGDEWNVIDYFLIDGLDGFFANFAEATRRATAYSEENAEEEFPPFEEVCIAHKDNIYNMLPPASGN